MSDNKVFPLIVTAQLTETKTYYVERLGAEVVLETPGYLQLRLGSGAELCFMPPEPKSELGIALRPFAGAGVIFSIAIGDPDRCHARFAALGAQILSPPSDKPWGWRSFTVADPNGVVLDFFEPREQAAEGDAAS